MKSKQVFSVEGAPVSRSTTIFGETLTLAQSVTISFFVPTFSIILDRLADWLTTIDKMYTHLEPGGRIAIVLQSPIGEVADFFNQFAHYDVQILELWRDLIQRYGDNAIEVRYFMNEIWAESLEDMVTIGLFLLIDPRFKENKEEMRQYFESHHKVPEGYRLMQDEILLVVKKT